MVVQPKHDFVTQEELNFHDQTIVRTQQKSIPQVSKPTKPVSHNIYQPWKLIPVILF